MSVFYQTRVLLLHVKKTPPKKQQTNKQTKQVQHDFLKLGLRVLERARSGFLVGR